MILLGPYLSGKSTIRRFLAGAIHLPQCSLDPFEDSQLCQRYYRQASYDDAEADRILDTVGYDGLYRYSKVFEASAVEWCVVERSGHIVEIGAPLSVYEDDRLLKRVQTARSRCANVILLLSSPDREESYRVLRERERTLLEPELNEHFLKHHSNRDLVKHIVYTQGKSAEETRDEIRDLITVANRSYTAGNAATARSICSCGSS